MNPAIERLREDLRQNVDESVRDSSQRFFKESVTVYGIKTARVTALAKEHFRRLRGLGKSDVFALCEELWQSGYLEESFVACAWSYAMRKQYTADDIDVFECWIDRYVTNWASCDTLCNHTVGALIDMYPDLVGVLKKWALSRNRWTRRASAVSLIAPARRGRFPDDALKIATILLEDEDDMVQKGYGWLLKVEAEQHQERVFAFVMNNKAVMPRTALRYAIEKMPPELKAAAMQKEPR